MQQSPLTPEQEALFEQLATNARQIAEIIRQLIVQEAPPSEWRCFFAELFETHGKFIEARMPPEALVATIRMLAAIFRDPDACEDAIGRARVWMQEIQPGIVEPRGEA